MLFYIASDTVVPIQKETWPLWPTAQTREDYLLANRTSPRATFTVQLEVGLEVKALQHTKEHVDNA